MALFPKLLPHTVCVAANSSHLFFSNCVVQGFEHPWEHGAHGGDHDDHGHSGEATEFTGYEKQGVGEGPVEK